MPPYVSLAISKASVLVTNQLEYANHVLVMEENLAFLFGKYLFIPKYKFDNHKIKAIEKIQKFDFVDNKLIIQTYLASSFEFGTKPNEDNDLYVTLIVKSLFKLVEPPNYANYFESILSKGDFENSLEDGTNEYYFIYFNLITNKILWEKYSSIEIKNSIIPIPVIDSLLEPTLGFLGVIAPHQQIILRLHPRDNKGILVLCNRDKHCYIARLSITKNSSLSVKFFNNEIDRYKKLLINEKLKVD